jgi:DNA-binding response OmpR family regulator
VGPYAYSAHIEPIICHASLRLKKQEGGDNYFNSRSMDVYLSKLRKYLKEDERVEILNIHGQGFRLAAPESA